MGVFGWTLNKLVKPCHRLISKINAITICVVSFFKLRNQLEIPIYTHRYVEAIRIAQFQVYSSVLYLANLKKLFVKCAVR